MQVTETLSEGLRRELKVTVPAADLEADIEGRLDELRKTVTMKGFRRGKVPLSIVRRHYQPRVLGEVLQQTIDARWREIVEERALRPAAQPEIEITAYDEGKDLEFTMGMEILPDIEFGDFSDLSVTRLRAEVSDETVEDTLGRLAEAEKRSSRSASRGRRRRATSSSSISPSRWTGSRRPSAAAPTCLSSSIPRRSCPKCPNSSSAPRQARSAR